MTRSSNSDTPLRLRIGSDEKCYLESTCFAVHMMILWFLRKFLHLVEEVRVSQLVLQTLSFACFALEFIVTGGNALTTNGDTPAHSRE
jgi:hypothetical protein